MKGIINMNNQKQISLVKTILLAIVCATGVVYLASRKPISHNEIKEENDNQNGHLRTHASSNNFVRNLKEADGDSTAPMMHLESVDGHIPWLHTPKTGSSFVNALLHFACANAPANLLLGVTGPRDFAKYTSISEYECSREYADNPLLKGEFHQNLGKGVYEHNKGKLIGMLREPKSHRISYAKHKFMQHYGSEGWKKFISISGLPEDDKSFSAMLGHTRGFEASMLYGENHAFRYTKGDKNEQAMIDKAKKRLTEGFQYIGITNRFPESICLFYSKFSKPGDISGTDKSCKPVVFQAVNTAGGHSSQFNFTDADWEYFKDYDDEVDREIYNHALELFEADLVRYDVTRDKCIARGCWPEADADDIEEAKKKDDMKSSNAKLEDDKWDESG